MKKPDHTVIITLAVTLLVSALAVFILARVWPAARDAHGHLRTMAHHRHPSQRRRTHLRLVV